MKMNRAKAIHINNQFVVELVFHDREFIFDSEENKKNYN